MKFLRFLYQDNVYTGVISADGENIIKLKNILPEMGNPTITEFIRMHTQKDMKMLNEAVKDQSRADLIPLYPDRIMPPIRRPIHDILCVGENYKGHADEMQQYFGEKHNSTPADERNTIYFSKRATRVLGDNEPIVSRTDIDEQLDYEVELAVIIGKEGRDIPKDQAEKYIFGYSIFNDITSRHLQKKYGQWFKGKSLDTYTAMGPIIVTKDEFASPLELDICSKVNGEIRQNSNTRMLMTDIPTIIHELSIGMTIEPGDIIATGTPAGVAMSSGGYMKKGDIVECEIAGIGVLRNKVK